MLALLSLILALLLTAAIVIVLHRFQESSRAKAADRDQSLPPLNLESRDAPAQQSVIEQPVAAEPPEHEQATPPTEAEPAGHTDNRADSNPETNAELKDRDTPGFEAPTDWKQQIQQLKESGDHEAALQVCKQAWPQWQSYQQAAIVIRAAIRSAGAEPPAEWLARLYQLAAEAGFLHDKVEGLPQPNWQTLACRFTPADLNRMDFDWQELGHQRMRLLTKTDVRQMTTAWGEPAKHQSAKQHYQQIFMRQSGY
jgi:hypothetical protein